MSRLVPWRNKPTPFILQMIPVSKQYKLYLVSQTGPTSFVFKDQNDNKFKVSIGLKLSCSCGIVQNDHCIHTLYVLLKKYKVDQNNPILWQASYLDSELDGLIQMKFTEKKKKPTNVHHFIKKKITDKQTRQEEDDDFPKLDGDQTCPICYEDLKFQAYSQCKQCHNCIHSKCLKVWTKHKQDNGMTVTCPMCRAQFINPMQIILRDLQKWQNKFLIHKGTKCIGCNQKNIKGWIFHCLICQNIKLCRLCFQSFEHSQHDKFFAKQNSNDEWKFAPSRLNLGNVSKTPIYKSIYDKPQESQFQKQLTKSIAPIKDKNISILLLFPTLKQQQNSNFIQNNSNNLASLNIIGNQFLKVSKITCGKCKKNNNQNDLRKLYCGHYLHKQCLIEKIMDKNFECQQDGDIICKGYLSALGIKIQKKKKIEQQGKSMSILQNKDKKELNKIINVNRRIQSIQKQQLKKQGQGLLNINSLTNNKQNISSQINGRGIYRIKKLPQKRNNINQQRQFQQQLFGRNINNNNPFSLVITPLNNNNQSRNRSNNIRNT